MQKNLKNNLKNNFLPLLCLLGFFIAVGVMSYLDLHPDAKRAGKVESAVTFYIPTNVKPEQVLDSNGALLIDQGYFSKAATGTLRYNHQGMKPALFAQRSIDLLVHLQDLPQTPDDTVAALTKLVMEWKNLGNSVISLTLDYHPAIPNPDFEKYGALLKALKKALPEVSLVSTANTAWIAPVKETKLRPIEETVLFYIFIAADIKDLYNILRLVQNFDRSFKIILPLGVTADAPYLAALEKKKNFMGFLYSFDPSIAWTAPVEKIGLFPKF